jgi:hypothetical protein
MDLSKLSNADLEALQSGDMSKVSEAGLQTLSGEAPPLWKTALNGIPKGAAGLADTITNAPENVLNLSRMAYGAGMTAAGRPDLAPTITPPPNRANDLLTKAGIIRPEAEPVNFPGRVADTVGQAIGGGTNPRAVVNSLSRGAVLPVVRDLAATVASGTGAALAGEAARSVDTGSDAGNTALQTGAMLVGGSAPGAAIAARGTGGDRAAAALKGVTREQLAMAQALQDKARAQGSPITGYEAIQSVTGLNPKMQTQQRIAEQSDSAAKTLTPMMQARPGANATLAGDAFNKIAPVELNPDALGGLMQSGATSAITTAHRNRSAQTGPFYERQRNSDAEAIGLGEQIPALQAEVANRTAARDQATQLGGKQLAYANEQDRLAGQWSPVPGQPTFPKRYAPQNDRAIEAVESLPEFESARMSRADELAAAQTKLNTAQDALAAKNLPAIGGKVNSYLSELDNRIKLAGPTAEGKILQQLRDQIAPNGEPILYPSQLESVYRAARDQTKLSAIPTPEQKTAAGVLGPHVGKLDQLIQSISPDIAAGRALHAQISRDLVSPMEKGQIGKLTRSDEFPQQAGVLLPEKPMDVTPQVVGNTIRTIDAEAPGVPARFLAQQLRGTFNEANGGGIANNPMGGYNFAKKVADNPMQRDNLIEALKASRTNPQALTDALDIFQAQGFKPSVNSATASNMAEGSALSGTKVLDTLTRPLSAAGRMTDAWRNGLASKQLAEALASPDSVKRLQEMARANGTYSPVQQQMLINLLLSQPSSATPQASEQAR